MKDKKVYIYTHQGLGDQIICNGLIRESAKKFGQVVIFSKQQYFNTIRFMYRDLNNVQIIPFVDEPHQVPDLLSSLPGPNDYIAKIGFDKIKPDGPFDEQFYKLSGLSFDKKWTSFRIQQNITAEKEISTFLNPNNKDYIFVHEDKKRSYCIKEENLPTGIKIVKPLLNLTDNIFNYIDIIQNAKQVHCIDSAFLNLTELIFTEKPTLFFHKYSKYSNADKPVDTPVLRKQWKIIR